jgi:hypothetical protein
VTDAHIKAVESGDNDWFPPSLAPEGQHERVGKLGPEARTELELRAARRAFLGGIQYEEAIVAPACGLLKWDSLGMGLDDGVRQRANLIQEQEAEHSSDMFRTLQGLEGAMRFQRRPEVVPLATAPARPQGGDGLLAGHELVWNAALVETAISQVLAGVGRHRRVVACVKSSFHWHHKDELTHLACFTDLIAAYWPGLPEDIRRHIAPRMGGYIRDFLAPDLRRIHGDLMAVGLTVADADRVLADAYPEAKVRADMRRAAHHSLECLNKAGAFEDGARSSLEDAGLLDP